MDNSVQIYMDGSQQVTEDGSITLYCKISKQLLEKYEDGQCGIEKQTEDGFEDIGVVNCYSYQITRKTNYSPAISVFELDSGKRVKFTMNATKIHSGKFRCFFKKFPTKRESAFIEIFIRGNALMHALM